MSAERAEVRCHVTCDGIACEFCVIAQLRAALADAQREVARLTRLQEDTEGLLDEYQRTKGELVLVRRLHRESEQRAAALEAALRRLGSVEAFVLAGTIDPEALARIDYARAALTRPAQRPMTGPMETRP